ncbi:MAG: DUF177 domain-containing protein [Bdellovibrionaceae bacterium]|nr:DUF177 domain-containing protein [Pseudobdellovibrionaceae bacterium]
MKINLSEIPEEGRSYTCNRKTAELNLPLKDLIGDAEFEAEFFIRPLNPKDFEVRGVMKTTMPEDCSRCGIDFELKIATKFQEILIPRHEDDRTGHYAKVNHISEAEVTGPSVTEYEDSAFDMGEYLHEVVAIAAPFNPVGPENEKGDCSVCGIRVRGRSFGYDEQVPVEKPASPFAALKNIKLN